MALLNGPQSRAILCGFLDVHRRMAELEALLAPVETPSAFSAYVNDLSPTEVQVVKDHFARIRNAMLGHLKRCEIPLAVRATSLRWALQTGVSFIGITVEELGPSKLRGYGTLDKEASTQSTKMREDLERLVDQVAAYLRQGLGRDLPERLAHLGKADVGVETLATLEKVVARWQLVEFRPALEMIVSRLENPRFEVAVFGRVSCGKSSLLNHIAGIDALPVGVTPVTAVPTRLVSGERPSVVVSFAESGPCSVGLQEIWEYASEEGNPGNRKHVTSILLELPSPRLREGIVFVDTPGLGALALSGAAETTAYLPQSDLGLVLVDSASTLNREDLALLRALYEAGIPAMVLLSKADVLAPGDRVRMTNYIREQLRREIGLDLPVHPVSTVGADESLFTGWFDEELTPLLDQHRSLVDASLKRKTAHLLESVIATLETLLAKRRGGRLPDEAGLDPDVAQQLLDEADETIRRTRERSLHWWEGRRALEEHAPRLVALAVMSAQSPANEGDLAGVIETALLRRGRTAHDLIAGLQDALASTLERLSELAPMAQADLSSIQEFHSAGLPTMNLGELGRETPVHRPWWGRVAPPLAVQAMQRLIQDRFGPAIKEAVNLYDRQLESWLKSKLARLVDLYEAQAGAFREQIRRLARDPAGAASSVDHGALEADLKDLRGAEVRVKPAAGHPSSMRPEAGSGRPPPSSSLPASSGDLRR
jgi:GTP-binding protein EngB required for normal cell division